MTYNPRQVRELTTTSELDLVRASHAGSISRLPARALKANIARARRLRDKQRDLLRRQRLAGRDRDIGRVDGGLAGQRRRAGHLGHLPKFLPTNRGFDSYYGILYSNDMRPVTLVENEQVVEYPIVQSFLTRKYTDRALEFIERNKSRPFLCYVPFTTPHSPWAAPDEYWQR